MSSEELLCLLRTKKGFIPSKMLAKEAGLSVTSIAKQIKILRKCGYNIESRQNRGYRLAGEIDDSVPWELSEDLRTLVVGKNKIIYRKIVHSTQEMAISLAQENSDSHGTVIIAEQQRSGRGRQKRKWISPTGGLWLSVVLKPVMPVAKVTLLPFAIALAVCDAIKKTTHLDVKLRWPNDIAISGKKVAGILIDVSTEREQINFAVIGIGINANVDSSQVSRSLGRGISVTSLSDELGHDTSMLALIKETLERLEEYYLDLEQRSPCTILDKWKRNSDILGQKVTVMQNNSKIVRGIAADVNDDGSLVVRTEDFSYRTIIAGDIRVRY
jgi:BirA family transcriptional regulator, biotin operon repressor / biotin---[acetyl-CoA-carboxylase] ligase